MIFYCLAKPRKPAPNNLHIAAALLGALLVEVVTAAVLLRVL